MSLINYLFRKLTKLIRKLSSLDNPLVTFGEIAHEKGTCCICGKKLHNQNVKEGHFSLIQIFKKATWIAPTAGLITPSGQNYCGFAISLICLECEKAFGNNIHRIQDSVKYAVEFDMRTKSFIYHEVKNLEDYPIII